MGSDYRNTIVYCNFSIEIIVVIINNSVSVQGPI